MKLLHVSSNVLRSLPNSISQCTTLETIYANGNLLDCIPNGIGLNLNNLRHFNISHNKIKDLPQDFVERFGNVDKKSGECAKVSSCSGQKLFCKDDHHFLLKLITSIPLVVWYLFLVCIL